MAEHVTDPDGNPLLFTCKNRAFKTNIEKGYPHGSNHAGGSVFPEPLIVQGKLSLWLEHVKAERDDKDLFWLMWYEDGKIKIPLSGVFSKEELKGMISKLITVRDELL